MQAISEALAQRRAQPDTPDQQCADYGATLLAHPVTLRKPPSTVRWAEGHDGRRQRIETANSYALYRRDAEQHRRNNAIGAVGGWTQDEINAAFAEDRKPFLDWYYPLFERFRELARTMNQAAELDIPHARTLVEELLEQGESLYNPLRTWFSAGDIPWLPYVNQGSGFPNVLLAWRNAADHWRRELGGTP